MRSRAEAMGRHRCQANRVKKTSDTSELMQERVSDGSVAQQLCKLCEFDIFLYDFERRKSSEDIETSSRAKESIRMRSRTSKCESFAAANRCKLAVVVAIVLSLNWLLLLISGCTCTRTSAAGPIHIDKFGSQRLELDRVDKTIAHSSERTDDSAEMKHYQTRRQEQKSHSSVEFELPLSESQTQTQTKTQSPTPINLVSRLRVDGIDAATKASRLGSYSPQAEHSSIKRSIVASGDQDDSLRVVVSSGRAHKRYKRDDSDDGDAENTSNNNKDLSSSKTQLLATSKLPTRLSTSSPIGSATKLTNESQACAQMGSLWAYMSTMYPTLARHLFDWSQLGRASDERPYLARSLAAARAVGNLLDEAERVLKSDSGSPQNQIPTAQTMPASARMAKLSSSGQTTSQQPSSSNSAAWLARVYYQNPAYARLIQRLRSKLPATRPTTSPSTLQSTTSIPTPTTAADNSNHVYGKVLHYPHELLAASTATATAQRTIEKLRLLNKQSEGSSSSLLRATGVANEIVDSELESNRIAPASAQSSRTSKQNSVSDSAADVLRDRIVYGNVVLRQNARQDGAADANVIAGQLNRNEAETSGNNNDNNNNNNNINNYGQRSRSQSSMQMLKAVSGHNTDNANNYLNTDNNNLDNNINHHHHHSNANDGSYGRVLMSPPADNPNTAPQTSSHIHRQQQQQLHHYKSHHPNAQHPTTIEPNDNDINSNQQQQHRHMKQSTLNRLKQQLELGLADPGQTPAPEMLGGSTYDNADEISKQNYDNTQALAGSSSVAGSGVLTGGATSSIVDDSSADFEGFFHSSPLQQIEVRQLRSAVDNANSNTNERQQTSLPAKIIRKSTSNPHDIFVVDKK